MVYSFQEGTVYSICVNGWYLALDPTFYWDEFQAIVTVGATFNLVLHWGWYVQNFILSPTNGLAHRPH